MQDQRSQNNNINNQKMAERLPVIQSNIVFSPQSQQNFLVDNYVCQSLPSPLGSFYQAFSPMQYTPFYGGGDLGTPIFVDNYNKNPDSVINNTNNNPFNTPNNSTVTPNNTPAFMLPLKIDNLKPDLIMPIVTVGNNKQSFNQFSRGNATSLKAFLKGQLSENAVVQFSPLQEKSNGHINNPENSLFEEKETQENQNQVPKKVNNSEDSSVFNETSQNSGYKVTLQPKISSRFITFNEILFRVFKEGTLAESDYENLCQFDKKLLYFLIKRKYLPKAFKNPSESNEEPSFSKLLNILGSIGNKRPEECYKFILTRVIKYLKHKFENNQQTKSKIEDSLYQEYFQVISDTYKIPLSDFHYPLTGSLKGKFKLNSAYFSKIFMSSKFVEAVADYSRELLLVEYSADIKKKLETLINRWAELLDSEIGVESDKQNEILDYVMFNKRCK